MLLHDVADRLSTVADQLPLTDQIRPDPALSEILDDEVRHLARLLGYLAGEHAFRHRAAARSPAQVTATQRRTSLALAQAAEPAAAALAALGAAVHHLGQLADLTHQAPRPARTQAYTAAYQGLVDRLGESRTCLARAAKQLRADAGTRPAPNITPLLPPTATTATSRTR
ncbi:hypothetical protein ACM01_16060 [Streptomyces viridochromogenes]|uniref:CHAD domain-containing protein n=1 Tax=Streptomyces viridochromogenes TaxID=1938 RepID=A0A0J7ZE55_STRVR|nr:hypothetical protein [Streptomyces viridochromogenes]KMS74124.1 hypothetical protein ACM01_16060 [Streptomyces viridochromogenes]